MGRRNGPFVPPSGGPAARGAAGNGAQWEIYDTYCTRFGPEEKEETDRRLRELLIRAEQKKLLESMESAERTVK